ncbi:MAG: hypothetical protein JWM86_2431 [Thermoleophilia bacterium]|nr:hypothetical protein [Thermoleophilia bacterium]
MLVRAGDGDWQQLQRVDELPAGGFRALCGADAANLLELADPLPIAAFSPNLDRDDARIDAIGLTHEGGIVLLLATFEESPRDTLWRIMHAAGALQGSTPAQLAQRCTELDGESLGDWLARRVGGDAHGLDATIAATLAAGAFDVYLVGSQWGSELAAPLAYLQVGPAQVRAFEIELLGAGAVQAIEGYEVPVDGSAPRTSTAAARPALTVVEAAPVHEVAPQADAPGDAFEVEDGPTGWVQPAWLEPHPAEVVAEIIAEHAVEAESEPELDVEPEPEFEPEVEPEQHWEPEAAAVEPEPSAEVEEEQATADAPLGDPSDEPAFLEAVDRLDHKSSAHMRYLHRRAVEVCDHVSFTCDGDVQYMVGWHGADDLRPLLGIDSIGGLQIVLSALPEDEQEEFANEVSGLLRESTGAELMEAGVAHLDVPRDLNDETLLEYVMDNLFEAMPGGRDAFGTHRVEPSEQDDPGQAEQVVEEVEENAERAAEHAVTAEHAPVETHEPTSFEEDFEVEEDFFAGMSTELDQSDIDTVTRDGVGTIDDENSKARIVETPAASTDPATPSEPAASQPTPSEPTAIAPKQGGFARRFRRKDAA